MTMINALTMVCSLLALQAQAGSVRHSANNASARKLVVEGEETFYTAITGWYDSCGPQNGSSGRQCPSDLESTKLDEPLMISLDKCYSNPNFDGRTVSFFSLNDDKDLVAHHVILRTEHAFGTYRPFDCTAKGECDCQMPPALAFLKKEFSEKGYCEDGDEESGYSCVSQVSKGISSDCYIPEMEQLDGGWYCSMAASMETTPADNSSAGDEDFGEAEMPFYPEDLDSRADSAASTSILPVWLSSLLTASGAFLMISCLFLGAVRHARNKRPLSINVIAEEEWIRPYSHDPMYSSRPTVNVVDFGDSLTDKTKSQEKSGADDRFIIS